MKQIKPQRPSDLDPIAVKVLLRLAEYPEAQNLILGGHLALKHYLNYRQTHDIDAWWPTQSRMVERTATLERLRSVVQQVADEANLGFDERMTRSMVSLELKRQNNTVFSVQIAERDVELERPIPSPWPPILIETLRDNLAAKMNALVDRGAPRDIIDIQTVIQHGVVTLDEVWQLWQQKNPRLDVNLAKAQVLKHLESIALRRPIDTFPPERRQQAQQTRRWVREELTRTPQQPAPQSDLEDELEP